MPKPDANQVMRDARRLRDERFSLRDTKLKLRKQERHNETVVEVPEAYQKTSQQHHSNIIRDEKRQIATLVFSFPTPHLTPPTPEDQPATTTIEQFLSAAQQELEATNGPVAWQTTSAQVDDNIGWTYLAPKKVPYKGQPKAPSEDATEEEQAAYGDKSASFKRDAGISAVFDYQHVNTATVYHERNIYDPPCIYIWKDVPSSKLKDYGVSRDQNGRLSTADVSGAGYAHDSGKQGTISILEYWDRDYCLILTEDSEQFRDSRGQFAGKAAYVLQEWKHGFGRVPYFARPAFVTEELDEDKRFAGPLDGIYEEMPEHKRLRTMGSSIAYQTAFSPLQVITEKDGDQILDDNSQPVAFLELVPGKARQNAPGQEIRTIPQSPEIANFYAEMSASMARMQSYTLSPVAKGISPGADTANAALSNLHRFQLSTLDPLADENARQGNAMFRFMLERIRDMGERVYVLNKSTDSYLSLAGDEIISVNVQCKATPDQGQQQLLIEKHAAELKQLGLITLEEMYSMWGKENPEKYVLDLKAEKLAETLEPVIMQQITADLGMLDAVNAMIQQNAQSGDARNAVPGLMDKVKQMNTGAGQGSAGQPRDAGVRMPVNAVNTQQASANGY